MNQLHYTLQDRSHLPTQLDWLTSGERARLDGFRFEKRRRDWLLGRWTAKLALLEVAGLPREDIGRIEIAAASDGAPVPRIDGRPCQAQLSLSHSNDRAFSAVLQGALELGCDIERIEARSDAFVDTFFTAAERERVERAEPEFRDTLVTMIWSAKESTLKALRTGLSVDTRSVEVMDDGEFSAYGWNNARVSTENAGEFVCRWRVDGRSVLSIVRRGPFT